jgi:hypothetical protein
MPMIFPRKPSFIITLGIFVFSSAIAAIAISDAIVCIDRGTFVDGRFGKGPIITRAADPWGFWIHITFLFLIAGALIALTLVKVFQYFFSYRSGKRPRDK